MIANKSLAGRTLAREKQKINLVLSSVCAGCWNLLNFAAKERGGSGGRASPRPEPQKNSYSRTTYQRYV